MIIIIHTRDSILTWFGPIAYIHKREKKIYYKHRDYKEYKTPINKYYSQTPKQPSFSAGVFLNSFSYPYKSEST